MSSGLYGGRCSDEPVVQIYMELDTLEPQKLDHWSQQLGKLPRRVAKPNGRHVNWYTRPFTMNLRYFRTDLAMGTWRYASCMSMDTVHSFSLMEARTEAWVSILNRGITRWSFKRERSMTGRKSPVFFGTRKRRLKKPLVSGRNTGSIAPLDKSLSTAVCKSLGVFLVLKEMGVLVSGGRDSHSNCTPFPSVRDARQSPNRFCHCWTKFVRRAPTRNVSMMSGRGRSSRRRFIPVGTTSATSPVESSSSLLLLRLSSLLTGLSLLLTLSSSCGGPTKGLPPPGTSTSRSVVGLGTIPHRPGLSSTKCCGIPEVRWKTTMKNLLLSEFHDLLVKPIGIWTHQVCPWKWCCPGSRSRRLVQQQMVQNNIPAYQLHVGSNSNRGCYGPHGSFGCYGDPLFEEWSSLILRCQRVDDGRKHDIRYRSIDCCSAWQLLWCTHTCRWDIERSRHGEGTQRAIQMGWFDGKVRIWIYLETEILLPVKDFVWFKKLERTLTGRVFTQRSLGHLIYLLDTLGKHGDMIYGMS